MKKVIGSCLFVLILFSCQRVSETKNEKKYVGTWDLTQMEVYRYNSIGEVDSSGSVSTVGELTLNREVTELTYIVSGDELMDEFPVNGDWDVYYFGNPHVLVINERQCTVEKIKEDELVFFHVRGDGTGKMKYKRIYHFKKR